MLTSMIGSKGVVGTGEGGARRSLDGRSALVVGGSAGIGAAVSLELALRGVQLRIHGGRRREPLDRLRREIRAKTGADPETVLQEIDILSQVEPIIGDRIPDILVVAFGPIAWSGFDTSGFDTWERITTMNLALPGALLSRVLPTMVERGYGRIVLFGASRGDVAPPSREATAYTAAKSGLVSLVRSAARYGGRANVACNLVCPGYVETEYLSPERSVAFARRAPSGALTAPSDLSSIVADLCSQERAVVNGAVVNAGEGLV